MRADRPGRVIPVDHFREHPKEHGIEMQLIRSNAQPEITATHHGAAMENGVDLISKGRYGEAVEIFRAVLAGNPEDAMALYNCGIALYYLGEYDHAAACYQSALRHIPDWIEAYHNLGQACEALNHISAAVAAYEAVLQIKPDYYHSAYRLSLLYRRAGDDQKAMAAIKTAVKAKPDSAEALCTLGMIYREQNRFEEAVVCLDQALSINPQMPQALYNKGVALQRSGQFEEGLELYGAAMRSDPAFAPAKWLYHLCLPMMYGFPEEIEVHRKRFCNGLSQLIETTSLETASQKAHALSGVGTTTNFYLQYQCRNDLRLQRKYGRFVHRVMQANYPCWSGPRLMPPVAPDALIRIGYVSTFMYDHTIGTFLSGWLEKHDHGKFEVHGYHVGRKVDRQTRHIRSHCHHFHYFAGDMERAAQQLDRDNLHLLVYSDIGMAPITLQLASLRLAPIQCKGWGHPVTTGLPTIDYYLSSDLMEPEAAQDHYSETLIRLPNLALHYTPPQLPENPKTRQYFQIPGNRFAYLSTQSIFKYLPQHDDIYPRIAKQVPNACFVFLANESASATAKFKERLKKAFASYGMVSEQYCVFSRRLNFPDFLSLNMAADTLLDSLEWSGGKTTLEAIGCGLPVVTLPGRFMRGRHASAMLKMMGLDETIAKDKDAYCAVAVRLANDPCFLSKIKAHITKYRSRLYQDTSCITALERFYRAAVLNHARGNQLAFQDAIRQIDDAPSCKN